MERERGKQNDTERQRGRNEGRINKERNKTSEE
jgi:hypothetical protein